MQLVGAADHGRVWQFCDSVGCIVPQLPQANQVNGGNFTVKQLLEGEFYCTSSEQVIIKLPWHFTSFPCSLYIVIVQLPYVLFFIII